MDAKLPPSALSRVLLALQEESLLGELRDLLRQHGYAVAASASGKKARETLDQQQFAAVLADSNLTDLSGLDLLISARQLQPDAARLLVGSGMTLSGAMDAINKAEIFRLQRLQLNTTQAMNDTLHKLVQTMQKPTADSPSH